jgi:outer membrane protein OmpA-like peptidoglycan-associated protein
LRKVIVFIMMLALIGSLSVPSLAYDETGKLGLSYRFGFHTVNKDPWKLNFAHGAEVKWGVHKYVAIALSGVYGRTHGGIIESGTLKYVKKDDSNGLKTYRLRNYIAELGPVVNLMPDKNFNVFLTAGAGVGGWTVRDPMNQNKIVTVAYKGKNYDLQDQQFTLMFGGGLEYFLIPEFSIGAGLRYHVFTKVLSDFKDGDAKDLASSTNLDFHKGLLEVTGVLTAYLGKCEDSDADGVCDKDDKCPDTPKGCKVDANGCPIDTDGDGVCDGIDKCPDTPKGCIVDITGCPKDTDGDGVCDGIDKCPDTPKDCKVDAVGCPLDQDHDGVPDCRDKCPDTPSCCKVDVNGCPIDSDNDGVCDGCDKCPGTPAGLKVDADGCPTDYKIEKELVLTEVQFIVNTWTLTDKAKKSLDEVVKSLAAFPHVNLEVQGYTDISGRKTWNDTLSQNRAQAVVDYFVTKGLDRDRFTAKGFGSENPKYDNKTVEGRVKNRRVEMIRLNQ